MIKLHKRTGEVYYYPEDIKSMEYTQNCLNEFKTKLILKLVGVREVVYVKETPAQILDRIRRKEKKKTLGKNLTHNKK